MSIYHPFVDDVLRRLHLIRRLEACARGKNETIMLALLRLVAGGSVASHTDLGGGVGWTAAHLLHDWLGRHECALLHAHHVHHRPGVPAGAVRAALLRGDGTARQHGRCVCVFRYARVHLSPATLPSHPFHIQSRVTLRLGSTWRLHPNPTSSREASCTLWSGVHSLERCALSHERVASHANDERIRRSTDVLAMGLAWGDAGRAILVEEQVYYDPEQAAFDAPPRTSGASRRGPSSAPVMGMPVPSAFAHPCCARGAERRTEKGVRGVAGRGSHLSAVHGHTQGVRVATDTAWDVWVR